MSSQPPSWPSSGHTQAMRDKYPLSEQEYTNRINAFIRNASLHKPYVPPDIELKLARTHEGELMVTASFSQEGTNLQKNRDGLEFVTRFDYQSMREVPLKEFGVEPHATDTAQSDRKLSELYQTYFKHAKAISTRRKTIESYSVTNRVDDKAWSEFDQERKDNLSETQRQSKQDCRERYLRERSNSYRYSAAFFDLMEDTRRSLQSLTKTSSRAIHVYPIKPGQKALEAELTEAIKLRHSNLADFCMNLLTVVGWSELGTGEEALDSYWCHDAIREIAQNEEAVKSKKAQLAQLNPDRSEQSNPVTRDQDGPREPPRPASFELYITKENRPIYVMSGTGSESSPFHRRPPAGGVRGEDSVNLDNMATHFEAAVSALYSLDGPLSQNDEWIASPAIRQWYIDPINTGISNLRRYISTLDRLETCFNTFLEKAPKFEWKALRKEFSSALGISPKTPKRRDCAKASDARMREGRAGQISRQVW